MELRNQPFWIQIILQSIKAVIRTVYYSHQDSMALAHKQMGSYSMFLGRQNPYFENDYTTKCNLQIQCDHYQITSGIFHGTRTKSFTIHTETQKTLSCKSSLEKEEWSWRNQPSWLQIIVQSYSHQNHMVLAQKQKYRPIEHDRKPRDKPKHLRAPYLCQKRQQYTMEKTVSSISGAGKTGQLHVKEWS